MIDRINKVFKGLILNLTVIFILKDMIKYSDMIFILSQ